MSLFIKMEFVLLVVFAVFAVEGAYEGDYCDANGVDGVCRKLRACPSALEDIKSRKSPAPVTCGFQNHDVIVCCRKDQETTTTIPVLTTVKSSKTTTEHIPQEYDYKILDGRAPGDLCAPIPANDTSKPNGQKAWDKCIEYQAKYVYPCEKSATIAGDYGRVNHCHHSADELVVGGVDAKPLEFPHMVLLGYKDNQNMITYQCGGALISERFVLTAGHCIADRNENNVSHALVGILRRSDESEQNRYQIKRIIKHDYYKSPRKYNDIALLELDRPVPLDDTTVPACLHTGDPVDDAMASIAGWGTTSASYRAESDILQKGIVAKFTTDECSEEYMISHNMPLGYHEPTQICYGDRTLDRSLTQDTCQGDSGGPLHVKSKKVVCMYTVIGVTSFGQRCAAGGVPAIYTRVSHYLRWIESIVWPD